jgi:PAS domain S-box-containing protein
VTEISREWLDGVVGILETLNQGVIINDDCGEIMFANSHYLQMMGLPAGEVIGRKVTDLFPPEDVPALRQQIERRQRQGSNLFEFYLPQRDGSRMPVVVTSRQIEDPDGGIFAKSKKIYCSPRACSRASRPAASCGEELPSKRSTSRCEPSAEISGLSHRVRIIST